MSLRRILQPGWALIGMVVVVGCGGPAHDTEPARQSSSARSKTKEYPPMGYTLELTGSGLGRPTTLDLNDLRRMKLVSLDNVLMQRSHSPDERGSWRGVPLDAILREAQLKPGPMNVTLRAEDTFTRRTTLELLDSAILALEDGQGRALIGIEEDHIVRLVPPHLPGDHWIVNLAKITVEPATSSSVQP